MSTNLQTPPKAVPAKPSLSPRRRRLRWTAIIVSVALVIGIVSGVLVYRLSRPQQYRPDEKVADITSSLARDVPADAPKPLLADVTRQAGLSSFRTFVGDRTSQLPEDMGPGAAWGDFNNDGYDDLFLVSAGGPVTLPPEKLAPCELYENLKNGTFRKVDGFPETRIRGMSAAWGDYDGDGFLDLIVTGYNALLLFHNEGGTGKFVRDARFPDLKGFWSDASWGDYDNDRWPDLYICGYVQYVESDADRTRISMQISTTVPYTLNPASYPGGTNLLFHNNGDGTFTEVAAQLGVTNPEGRSLGGLWHDFDDDGWLDLYVANDVSDNVFYHNRGGKFEDISHPAWVADYRSAMGLAAGDYNRDGDDDLFVAHWVAQENALYDNLLADLKRAAARTNASPGSATSSPEAPPPAKRPAVQFIDIADMKGLGQIALPYVGWGAEFVDFDGDGWLDLIVANGNTIEAEGPPPKKLKAQEAFLFWNQRGEHFFNLAPLNKSLAEPHVSRGLAVADYDNDGAMDILITHLGEGVQLLRNEMQTGNWLKVRLHSRLKNGQPLGFGDGAKVIAHIGDIALRRSVTGVSYLSQHSRTLHFGLGQAKQVDRLEVRWLGGGTNFFDHLEANATWEITEGNSNPKMIRAGGTTTVTPEIRIPQPPIRHVQSPLPSAAADKARLLEFWNKQRAAMNAMKVDKDWPKASQLFREALALDPQHEDSRYYLAHCLAAQGDITNALAQLQELQQNNSHSHRAFQQWGCLRATFAASEADLAAAEKSLEQAHALNPEETGALLVLGEVSLLRGGLAKAEERLTAACRSNPKAVGGFFLRGYLAWKRGDQTQAEKLLQETRQALGKDWQPKGATSEGDVKQKQHVEATPLTRFWEEWDGVAEPAKAFAPLEARLSKR